MNVNRFHMNEEGLNRFFGSLEARIMEYLWQSGDSNIKEVQETLNAKQPISFNAVMTVMNRLCDKGHLIKKNRGRLTYFQPVQSKEQFLYEQTKVVTEGLMGDYGDLVVNHMLDSLEQADSILIDKLEKRLDEMKKRKKL